MAVLNQVDTVETQASTNPKAPVIDSHSVQPSDEGSKNKPSFNQFKNNYKITDDDLTQMRVLAEGHLNQARKMHKEGGSTESVKANKEAWDYAEQHLLETKWLNMYHPANVAGTPKRDDPNEHPDAYLHRNNPKTVAILNKEHRERLKKEAQLPPIDGTPQADKLIQEAAYLNAIEIEKTGVQNSKDQKHIWEETREQLIRDGVIRR